jgi:HSP20 family protein
MSNLNRYDPFSIDPVSDMFHGLFRPLRGLVAGEDDAPFSIRVDVSETDNAYEVKADMPGLKKEDIDVRIDGNIVSISATVERKKEQKEGERVIRTERYTGSTQRSFSLASEIDAAKVVAQYENGTLALTLPKKASAERQKIEIK